MSRSPCRQRPTHTPVWFWALAILMLVKAAVPLLATAAAGARGVDLVEVCSVYGLRMVQVEPQSGEHPSSEQAGHGATDGHCALSSVLGPATPPVDEVRLSPLPGSVDRSAPPRGKTADRPDPVQRWLVGRLHAPPLRA